MYIPGDVDLQHMSNVCTSRPPVHPIRGGGRDELGHLPALHCLEIISRTHLAMICASKYGLPLSNRKSIQMDHRLDRTQQFQRVHRTACGMDSLALTRCHTRISACLTHAILCTRLLYLNRPLIMSHSGLPKVSIQAHHQLLNHQTPQRYPPSYSHPPQQCPA